MEWAVVVEVVEGVFEGGSGTLGSRVSEQGKRLALVSAVNSYLNYRYNSTKRFVTE